MHSSNFIVSLITSLIAITIAGLASANPLPRDIYYYGVSINVTTSAGMDANKTFEAIPVRLNTLVACGYPEDPCSASVLTLDPNGAVNVDIGAVECRAYQDFAGTQPGSAPFNVTQPAYLSTNLATVSTILCYLVELN
jgi:hypothetical protein